MENIKNFEHSIKLKFSIKTRNSIENFTEQLKTWLSYYYVTLINEEDLIKKYTYFRYSITKILNINLIKQYSNLKNTQNLIKPLFYLKFIICYKFSLISLFFSTFKLIYTYSVTLNVLIVLPFSCICNSLFLIIFYSEKYLRTYFNYIITSYKHAINFRCNCRLIVTIFLYFYMFG